VTDAAISSQGYVPIAAGVSVRVGLHVWVPETMEDELRTACERDLPNGQVVPEEMRVDSSGAVCLTRHCDEACWVRMGLFRPPSPIERRWDPSVAVSRVYDVNARVERGRRYLKDES
jgi:hypothetical protein